MENLLWLFAVGGGPFLLGAVIFYALMRQRRLRPGEKAAQDDEVANLYGEDDRRGG